MPSQSEVKWSQLKVGVIVAVALILLVTLIFLMTSATGLGLFSHKITVRSYFQNSNGVKNGAPVTLQGVTIGNVESIRIISDPSRKLTPVEITMKIDDRYQSMLKKDTKSSLSQVGMLGDTVVDLNSQYATGPKLQDGDVLLTLEKPNIQDVVKSSQGTIESLNAILAKLDLVVDSIQQGKGTIGMLVNDPSLYKHANATLEQLQLLSQNLNSGKGSVGKLLHDDTLYNNLNDTSAKLDHMINDLDAGKGSAGKLLKDETLYNNLNSTLQHANSLLAEADAGHGALGKLTKDPAFAQKLDDTVTHLNSILGGIDRGEGTAGKIMKDPSLYNNLDKLAVDSQMLMNTIRSDPKKYLTIHFKVF